MKAFIILLSLLFAIPSAKASENFKPLDTFLKCFEQFGFPGSVLIAKGNNIVFEKSYGVNPGSAFYIASVSKLFTAAAIYKLEQEGMLNVNDSLPAFFENVPDDKKSITVKQLLTHTSGLPGTSYEHVTENIFDKDEALTALLNTKLAYAPGTDEDYSGNGYTMLALIIEKVSGKTFEEYMRSSVFAPSGMSMTGFTGDSLKWAEGEAADMKYGILYKGSPQYLKLDWAGKGAAGMMTTARDLFSFVRSGMPVYDFYWSDMKSASGDEIIYSSGDDDAIGHNALLIKYPQKDITVIILTNAGLISGVSVSSIIAVKVDEALNGRLITGDLNNDKVPGMLSESLTGRYFTQMGDSAVISKTKFRTIVSGTGQELINSISGTNAAIYNDLNAQANFIISALKRNDSLEVFRLITNQKVAKQLFNLWKGLVKKFGAPGEITVKGTSKVWWHPGAAAATWVEFKFEKDARLYRLEWSNDGSLMRLGGSAIKNPLTGIAGKTAKGENVILDIGNNTIFRIKKSDDGIGVAGEEQMELMRAE
jgi:hypothetical protein